MKFGFINSSKAKKVKEKFFNNEDQVTQFGFKSQSSVIPPLSSFRNTGSKEDTFFDSQAWLDSDCEDDFLSVNGDFTPSRGSTSDDLSSSTENFQLNKSQFMDRTPDLNSLPSPTDGKKKLSELLQDSLGGDEDKSITAGELQTKPANHVHPSKSANGVSHLFAYLSRSNSVRSSERTPKRYSKSEKENSVKAGQCCLPSLVTSLSFSERKKRLSPDLSDGE